MPIYFYILCFYKVCLYGGKVFFDLLNNLCLVNVGKISRSTFCHYRK